MFEERCLTCGNHLHDDGRAYCSDECQVLDTSSPCLSSASSAFSSPRIEYAVGGEVPPLIPSALGSALRGYRHRQSASSSSASSTSWSLDTDDEDQDDDDAFLASVSDADTADSASQISSKSSSAPFELYHRPLSYARRPSGTNTRSTVPHLNKRGSSGSISGGPYSTDDCASFSDDYSEQLVPQSAPERDVEDFVFNEKDDTLTKNKRRNRASLPSYFSLLQIGGSPRSPFDGSKKGSPTVSTSSQTIARPSPPTPKLTLAGFTASLPPFTSRGRKLMSRGSHSSFSSSSRSQSNPAESGDVYANAVDTVLQPRPRLDSRGTTSPLLDKVSHPRRGRAAIRRNSSPPAKLDGLSTEYSFGRRETTEERRGRARREELDGIGGPNDAPGFGHGRSGLLHREGRASSRFR